MQRPSCCSESKSHRQWLRLRPEDEVRVRRNLNPIQVHLGPGFVFPTCATLTLTHPECDEMYCESEARGPYRATAWLSRIPGDWHSLVCRAGNSGLNPVTWQVPTMIQG